MSEVGDLLELLHGASRRWNTARMVTRRWGDHEAGQIAFDEDFSDEVFQFVPPNGGPTRASIETWPRVEQVSVEEAARRASFTVLVPKRLPVGWTITAGWYPGVERGPFYPQSVIINVLSEDRHEYLHIYESSEPSVNSMSGPPESSNETNWELVEQDGRRIELHRHLTSAVPIYDAKIEVSGTLARATGLLGRTATLDIVGSLRPVSEVSG